MKKKKFSSILILILSFITFGITFLLYPIFHNTTNMIFTYLYFAFFYIILFVILKISKVKKTTKKFFLFSIFPVTVFQICDMLLLSNILSSFEYSKTEAIIFTKNSVIFSFYLVFLLFLFMIVFFRKKSFLIFDTIETNNYDNQLIKRCSTYLYFVLPICIFITIVSKQIWILFYENNNFGILSFFLTSFLQSAYYLFLFPMYYLLKTKQTKKVSYTFVVLFLVSLVLKKTFAYSFYHIGINSVYGASLSNFLGYLIATLLAFYYLFKNKQVDLDCFLKKFFDILICVVFTSSILMVVRTLFSWFNNFRLGAFFQIVIYFLLFFKIYVFFSKKIGLYKKIINKS